MSNVAGHDQRQRNDSDGPPPSSLGGDLVVLAALLALLAATIACAFIPMGVGNMIASLTIAVAKALLVMVFYMRLKRDAPLLRIVAAAGFAFLTVLIVFTLVDVITRIPLLTS